MGAFANGCTLFGWIEAAMQAVDFGGDTFYPLRCPLNFGDTRQEGQHIALNFLCQCAADGCCHFILDTGLGLSPDMAQFERP